MTLRLPFGLHLCKPLPSCEPKVRVVIRRVDGRNNPYVFSSKVHYYIIGAHLLCAHYIDSFLLKFKILNQVPIVHINGFMAC